MSYFHNFTAFFKIQNKKNANSSLKTHQEYPCQVKMSSRIMWLAYFLITLPDKLDLTHRS
jgi:hypothetical protein